MDQKFVFSGRSRVDITATYYLKRLGIGENDYFILDPHSIGDVYHTLCLLKAFREKFVGPNSRIFFWSQPRTAQLFSMFNVADVRIDAALDYNFANLFAQRYRLASGLPISMATDIYADGWLHHLQEAGLISTLHIKRLILGLDLNCELHHAVVSDGARVLAEENAKAASIIPGRSLVIVNHATSVLSLPVEAFLPVVEAFPGPVFTDMTPPGSVLIPGTKPITIPLDQVVAIGEICGHVLALRSGVVDILSNAETNLFTIYPRVVDAQPFHPDPEAWAKSIHRSSLAAIGLRGNVIEREIYLQNDDDVAMVAERLVSNIISRL